MSKALSSYFPPSGGEAIVAIIQVGINNPAHFHFGYLTKVQAIELVSRNTISYDNQSNTNMPDGVEVITTDVNMHTHTVKVNFNNFTGEFFIQPETIPAGHEGRILLQDSTYVTCTKAQMDIKISNNELHPGTLYKITGVDIDLYGGTDIFLTALTTNTLSSEGYGVFYNPPYNQNVTGYKVWNSNSFEPDTSFVRLQIVNTIGEFQIGETINGGDSDSAVIEDITNNFILISGFVDSSNWSGGSITGVTSGATADVIGTWQYYSNLNIGDQVIWGGKIWYNITGDIGYDFDTYNLDNSNWICGQPVPINSVIDDSTYTFTGNKVNYFRIGIPSILLHSNGSQLATSISSTLYDSGTDTTTVYFNNSLNGTAFVSISIPNEVGYNSVIDKITYDYENDTIISRYELKGDNIVQFTYSDLDNFGNPINAFQWGNGYNLNTGTGIGKMVIYNSNDELINFTGDRILNNRIFNNSGIIEDNNNLTLGGQIKIQGGSPGNNKVLKSDGGGLATWQPAVDVTLTDPTNGDVIIYQSGILINSPSTGGGSGGFKYLELVTMAADSDLINGATTYNNANFISSYCRVYINGIRQPLGITDSITGTITFNTALSTDDVLEVEIYPLTSIDFITWYDIDFDLGHNLGVSNRIYEGLVDGLGVWYDNYGIATNYNIADSLNGVAKFQYVSGGEVAILGLDPSNTNNWFSSYDYGVYLASLGQIYVIVNGTAVDSGIAASVGDWLAIKRKDGVVTVEKSSDGENFITVYTFSATTTAQLYIHANINLSTGFGFFGKIAYPQFKNIN